MKTKQDCVCPRCDYPLVPVYAVEGTKRNVIALTCPEPYCDHMQMVPRAGKATPGSVMGDESAWKAAN